MEDSLLIKNFGPIKEADIKLKPLLLLIGGQGTGKSTIAKVLSICRDVLWYNLISINENIFLPFKESGIDEYFQDDSYIKFCEGIVTIIYNKGKFSITISGISKKEIKEFIANLIVQSSKKILGIEGELTSEAIKDNWGLIRTNARTSLYIPAERNIAGNLSDSLASMLVAKIPMSNIIMEYIGLFEKAKKQFPNYTVPFLQLSFSKTEKEENIIIKIDQKEKKISLKTCSSGIQSVLPLLMVIDYSLETGCFTHFIVEEPEQNLFPTNQMELLRFLIRKMDNQELIKNLIITTHSPYLLSVLNISILAAIVAKDKELSMQVDKIIPAEMRINPERVAVYALGNEEDIYCKSVINEDTGTIEQNYLDSVSDTLSTEFNQLYKLYIKSIRKA